MPIELNRLRDALSSAKYPQHNLFDMDEKFQCLWNFYPKNLKNQSLGPKMAKNDKNRKFFAIFLVAIDLEWSKTCFKTKVSSLKIFAIEIFSKI